MGSLAAVYYRTGLLLLAGIWVGSGLTSCRDRAIAQAREVTIQQTWELTPGKSVGGFRVVAGLGDISLEMGGARVHAPFTGEVELAATAPDCVFFSSSEVPAYLFRYCGLRRPRLGKIQVGQSMGRAQFLHFATLRRQPEGTWAIVEPSQNVLELSLD